MSYVSDSQHWQQEPNHWRQQLNNWLQDHGGANQLSWDDSYTGLQNNPTWTAIAMINNVEYGRGQGGNKGAAREVAAYHALRVHQAEVIRRNNYR